MFDQNQLGFHVLAVVGRDLTLSEPDLVCRSLSTQLDQNRSPILEKLVLHKEPLYQCTHEKERGRREEREYGISDLDLVVTDAGHVSCLPLGLPTFVTSLSLTYLLPRPGVSWIEVVQSLLKPLLRNSLVVDVVRVSLFARLVPVMLDGGMSSQRRAPPEDLVRDHETGTGNQEQDHAMIHQPSSQMRTRNGRRFCRADQTGTVSCEANRENKSQEPGESGTCYQSAVVLLCDSSVCVCGAGAFLLIRVFTRYNRSPEQGVGCETREWQHLISCAPTVLSANDSLAG